MKNIFHRLHHLSVKKVVVICLSGVSATVYSELGSTLYTVHSFYGLGTADLPWKLFVDQSIANNLVRERVQDIDVLIWDEISMSSSRIFELVNAIHARLANSSKPFGGKQVIVAGEFMQLRSVPDLFDDGEFAFLSMFSSAPFLIALS